LQTLDVATWLKNTKTLGASNVHKFKVLSPEESAKEYIATALRTNLGVNHNIFKRASNGKSILEFVDIKNMQYMIDGELLKYIDNNLFIKPRGLLLLDLIIEKLFKK